MSLCTQESAIQKLPIIIIITINYGTDDTEKLRKRRHTVSFLKSHKFIIMKDSKAEIAGVESTAGLATL